ncbi:MAG: YggT family protein [Pseudomonadota bacterium]
MTAGLPVWVLALDYLLGAVMWTLVGRAALSLFLPEDSSWGFMRIIVRMTNPVLRVFRPITPGFLVAPMVPLFAAWFFYMTRFYILPPLLGFGVMGTLSFPLESDIAQLLGKLLN